MTDGASHADLALARARARAWAPTGERAEILTALTEVFTAEDLGPDRAIEAAAVLLAEALDDAVFIDLLSPDRTHMYPLGAHHADPATRSLLDGVADVLFRADEGFTASVLETGGTLLLPSVTPAEVAALQPDLAPIAESLGVRGFIVAPLVTRGRCSGFVWQVRLRPQPRLDEDERRFLEEVAVRLAMFVESWRQGEALELAVPRAGGLAGVLTAREREILELVARGDTDRSIADRLGLSARTIEWSRQRMQARLGVRTRAELVAFARSL